jgi:DNA polymerase III epsilon subunit-like protein
MEELAALILQLDIAEARDERAALADQLHRLRDGLPPALDNIPAARRNLLLRRREQERADLRRRPEAPAVDGGHPAAVPAMPAVLPAAAVALEDCVLVFYDFETTGLSNKHDRIVEIGAIALRHNATTGEWVQLQGMQLLVNPGMPIPAVATSIHNITDAMVADAVTPIEGLHQLREFIHARPEPTIVMAHNGMRFDRHFVRQGWQGQAEPFDPPNVRFWGDSISLFKLLAPARFDAYALGFLYRDLGGPTEEAHRALGDARMMKYVLNQLWARREQGFDSSLAYLSLPVRNLPAHAALRNRVLFPLLG